MTVDYFFVRNGNLFLSDMFTTSPAGRYFYTRGVNFRGLAAFVIGFVLPLPGFIGSFGTTTVGSAATRMFDLGWVLSYVVGGASYTFICLVTARKAIRENKGRFEANAPRVIDTGLAHDRLVVDGMEIVVGVPASEQEQQQEPVSVVSMDKV